MGNLTRAGSVAVVPRGRTEQGEGSDDDNSEFSPILQPDDEFYAYRTRKETHQYTHRGTTTIVTGLTIITATPTTNTVSNDWAADEQDVGGSDLPAPIPEPEPPEYSRPAAATSPVVNDAVTPSPAKNPSTLVTKARIGGLATPDPTNNKDMAERPTRQPTGPLSAVPSQYQSRYRGPGPLLTVDCASAEYTLLDAGPTMFYAPFVGCINKRPGCCPFTPKTMTNTRSRFVVATQLFPQPLNEQDATLSSCASDYHSISGGCCPRGYEPWTSALGDQTPCVSQLPVTTTAPPLVFTTTGGSTTKPTVTMTGVVFAMQYPVLDSDDAGLSAGAIAGITVGCVLGVLAVIGIAFLIRRHRQQSHQLTRLKRDLHDNFYGPDAGTSEVPTGARDLTASNLEQLRAHRFNFAGMAKEEQADSPAELYAPGSPDLTLHGSTQRGSALTPRPEDYARDFFELPSTGETIHELSAGPEVQMAKPQRLSRGYPRIVYTQSQGQASSTSIQSDSEGRPGSGSSGRLSTRPSTVPPTRSDSIGPEPAGGRLTAGRASP